MRIVALILAGGRGSRLSILSEKRAKPAVPFAGKYRIIDFTLSNCVNSNIYDVGVLTQYRPYSLNQHVGRGRPWDLDRNTGGVVLLHPYLGRGDFDWYLGTADAVRQNLDFVRSLKADLVLILAGDHVYKMDYGALAEFHRWRGADVTIPALPVPPESTRRLGMLTVDRDQRITAFTEKPERPTGDLASMGIYLFNPAVLEEQLSHPARRGDHDFGRHILPPMVKNQAVYAYPFSGYWVDVGTIESYWQAHMDLLTDHPSMDLEDVEWRIHTVSEERPPAKIWDGARIERSLVSHGCVIEGAVRHSVLSPGVRVARGAVVSDSILMTDCVVREEALVDRAILDKRVIVGRRGKIGWGDDLTPNATVTEGMASGVTLVGKNTVLPDGLVVGRNCVIAHDLGQADLAIDRLPSGQNAGV